MPHGPRCLTARRQGPRCEGGAVGDDCNAIENGHSPGSPETQVALKVALEFAGVELIPENGGGAGVRLKKARKEPVQPSEGEAGIIDNNEM